MNIIEANSELTLHEVKSLRSSRIFLSEFKGKVILTEAAGSTRYYGMLVLDYIFTNLKDEFLQVKAAQIMNMEDKAAYFTAMKLGYKPCQDDERVYALKKQYR